GRHRRVISFFAARRGAGPSPELVTRLLRRLDREGIQGELELVGSDKPPAGVAGMARWRTFASAWDAELAALPEDWSDLYIEVELFSSDYLERAALLLAPLNPARYGGKPGFRCRVARRFGYGGLPVTHRRGFPRRHAEGIRRPVTAPRAPSHTRPRP